MSDKRQSRIGTAVINNKDYMLFEEIGRGATSVCYRSICEGKRYVVKEFYPISVAVRDSNGKIVPSQEENAETVFKTKKKAFVHSAKFHSEKLHNIQRNDFLSVVEIDEENGFIVMNDTDGQTLSDWAKKQPMNDDYIRNCVSIVKGIIDEAEKYHQNGYVHLDLKAENIYKFNIENNQVLTRIFDFDSIQKIDELYESIQNGTAHIHTTNECYGNEIGDINRQKANYITKEMLVKLDYYAIAKILYYLIYGCYEKTIIDDDSSFEEIYDECTVLNNYLHNLFDKLCGNIEKRDYSAEEMKGYIDKIIFIIDNQNVWKMYSEECLSKNFKSHLMSDIVVEDKVYTMQKGISAIEQVASECKEGLFLHGYDGGRGKTTALKWLMFRMTGSINELCLYVPLYELQPGYDIAEQICRRYSLKGLPENCILLLDGYNEIENTKVKEAFDKFFKDEKSRRIIISGRDGDELFQKFKYCRLLGIPDREMKNGNDAMLRLSEELKSNPMIVDLYSGIDIENVNADAVKSLIGVYKNDKIIINSMGEALWNYFNIQIYEKSNGYIRAEEEYRKYFFDILPEIATYTEEYYFEVDMDETNISDNDRRIFERCNKMFSLLEDEDGIVTFKHQNYFDFFNAIVKVNEVKSFIEDNSDQKWIPDFDNKIANDLMGLQYCMPVVGKDTIIVPKEYKDSYFGNGKKVIESEEIRYAMGQNLMLEMLECLRGNFEVLGIVEFLRYLPRKHMNFSSLNIEWLLPHYDGIYNKPGKKNNLETYTHLDWVFCFENMCFDNSLIKLQDDSSKFFGNCSFKNLEKESSIPYILSESSEDKTLREGNCIYSEDKRVLLDYVGPERGRDEIIIYPLTEKIDEAFRMHCKNPDAEIKNESKYFKLKDKALYRIFENESQKTVILEFCQRDVNHFEVDEETILIKSYACAYCKKLVSIDMAFQTSLIKIYDNAFAECTLLKKFKLPPSEYLGVSLFSGCCSLEEVAVETSNIIDLGIFRECKNLKKIRIKDYSCKPQCCTRSDSSTEQDFITKDGHVEHVSIAEGRIKHSSGIENYIDLKCSSGSGIYNNHGVVIEIRRLADGYIMGSSAASPRRTGIIGSSAANPRAVVKTRRFVVIDSIMEDTCKASEVLNIPEDATIYVSGGVKKDLCVFGLRVVQDCE